MPTNSFLVRRAIYQSLNSETSLDGKAGIAKLPQKETGADGLSTDGKRLDSRKRKPAEIKSDPSSDIP